MGTHGRIMVSLLLTVCACVFSILNTEAKPAPCLPICPDDPCRCGRNRGANYMNWWTRPTPQFPQYGNYGPQLPQYGNFGPQFPQYGNYGGLWGGNKAARPPKWHQGWWGHGPGTNIQIGK